jgi:hypothetical protein
MQTGGLCKEFETKNITPETRGHVQGPAEKLDESPESSHEIPLFLVRPDDTQRQA